jgi:hypothetical protein
MNIHFELYVDEPLTPMCSHSRLLGWGCRICAPQHVNQNNETGTTKESEKNMDTSKEQK